MSSDTEEKSGLENLLQTVVKPCASFILYALPRMITTTRTAYAYFQKLPQNCLTFIYGFVTCFFGGTFPTLFAAIQAAEYGGRRTFVKAVSDLAEEAMVVVEASKKDDDVDANKDGKSDAGELDGSEYLARKTALILRKMNPEKVEQAINSLYSVWLSVAAVLSIEFARTISMALAIAEFLNKPCDHILTPALNTVIPDEYEKWIPVLFRWITKSIAMGIAWYIQSIVSAATSALKGGLLMARSFFYFCVQRKINVFGLIPEDHKQSNLDEVLSYLFAAMGFYFQFKTGFALPFPLNLILWPFEVAEYYIRWSITSES